MSEFFKGSVAGGLIRKLGKHKILVVFAMILFIPTFIEAVCLKSELCVSPPGYFQCTISC